MGMRRRDSDDDDELRRLLAGMSAPTPVPDDLAERISRSLAEEGLDHDGRPLRFDPATDRPRRRLAILGTAVAGVVALTGVVGAVALHVDDDVVLHQARAAWDAVGGDEGSETTEATRGAEALPPLAFAAPETDVPGQDDTDAQLTGLTVLASGTDYRADSVTRQIAAAADGHSSSDPRAAGTARIPSRESLARCLATAHLSPHQALVDVATYEKRPALVLLGDALVDDSDASGGTDTETLTDTRDETRPLDDDRRIVVLPASCATSDVHPLAGPLPVP